MYATQPEEPEQPKTVVTRGVGIEQHGAPEPRPKRGAHCCGFCCDMRRAVIIVSLIEIILAVLSIPIANYNIGLWNATKESGEYDVETVASIDSLIEEYWLRTIIYLCVSIFAAICGLVGAIKFLAWPVFVPVLWYVASIILSWVETFQVANELGVEVSVVSLVISTGITTFFIYPYVGFISEVKRGIMTEEDYVYEEASCCCV